MIESVANMTVAERFRKWPTEFEAQGAYVRQEHADPGGSWMDCVTPEEIAEDEQQAKDLRYAAAVLDGAPDLKWPSTSSK